MKAATSIIALACFFLPAADADIVIEFKNQGNESQFLTNGKMARINTRGTDDYMLVDFDQNTIYSITPEQQQVINISDSLPATGGLSPPPIKLKLTLLDKGPTIAGYPTTQYRLSANGEHCGSIYASKEALSGSAIENMFDTLKTIANNHMQALGGFAALIPVCQLAQMELANKLEDIGAPMRMTNEDGDIDSEITKILIDAAVEPDQYALSTSNQLTPTAQQNKSAQSQSQQQADEQQVSDKRRSPRTRQPYSHIPPEATIYTRRYQEMMRYR
ncbi:MAG: hypothetical protein KJP15_08055 [Gammaproteobacteria bacterium]|nr:hypothetical protein [Gammaproteobacteria bacterium]